MAKVQPVVPEPEQLLQAHKVQLERHILEGTVRKPEQHRSALSEHRLVYKLEHTPQEHNTKEPLAHTREHKPPPEQHNSVWPCSTSQPERHTMVSSSTG
jgi:hypothetical protein